MSKAWSHLPNAPHIDWVLKAVNENTELWDAAWNEAWNAARVAAWFAARDAARDAAWFSAYEAAKSAARDAAWFSARDAARDVAISAARGVISALVAYDDCDHFLSMGYEQLKVWSVLSEDPRAILLLPMVYVKEKLNEQCLVTSV